MKDEKNEFLGLLCNLYLVVLLAALPLYTGNGYWQLGDTKYTLFRNFSFLCLGGWLLAGMPGRVRNAAEYFRKRKACCKVQEKKVVQTGLTGDQSVCLKCPGRKTAERKQRSRRKIGREQTVFSSMDIAMMSYGICVILSAVCSSYGKLAWVGYEGWYMGAGSQLLFIGIYFFVSRQYTGEAWPLYLGEAAFFLVTVLGLLHRLGIDPLGLMGNWNSGDWEYSHMLSTLGNINWLCGYYSVAMSFVIVHYFREKRRCLQGVMYLISVSAFVLLLLQGSQSGLLILGACAAVCFLLGRWQGGVWGKLLLLPAGTFFCMPLMEVLMRLRGSKAAVVADGNIFAFTSWHGWMLAAAACLFLFLLLERKGSGFYNGEPSGEKDCQETASAKDGLKSKGSGANEDYGTKSRESETMENEIPEEEATAKEMPKEEALEREKPERKTWERKQQRVRTGQMRKMLWFIALAAFAMMIVLAGLLFWRGLDDSFGSGRGFLWRIAVESFMEADGKDKLLGAGPDCYGEAVFGRLGADTDVWKGEHWEGAVFTNAHNEILSQLCNVGILGTASYLAIFLAGMYRYGYSGGKRMCGEKNFGEVRCREAGAQSERLSGEEEGIEQAKSLAGETESIEQAKSLAGEAESIEEEKSLAGESEGQKMFRNPEGYRKHKMDRQGRQRNLTGVCMGGTGLLALAMYGLHSMVSFQQVLNAPLLFLVLGLCEAERRKRDKDGAAA